MIFEPAEKLSAISFVGWASAHADRFKRKEIFDYDTEI
jgi:hypothetical protein